MRYEKLPTYEPTMRVFVRRTLFGKWKVKGYHDWDWTGDEPATLATFNTQEEANIYIDRLTLPDKEQG